MRRVGGILPFVIIVLSAAGCQNPTSPDEVADFSQAVTIGVDPDPIAADSNTGGKTYRVVRGNNQPDELLRYDWHAVFSTTLTASSDALKEELNLDFPIRITGATVAVKQATGGIITPPSGTEKEAYDYVTLNASGNQFAAVGNTITMTFEVWYDLPSLLRESVMTLSFAFVDNDGGSFQRSVDFRVAP